MKYGDRLKENFEGKSIPKENASYKCLSWIALESAIRVNKKYFWSNTFGRAQKHNKKE